MASKSGLRRWMPSSPSCSMRTGMFLTMDALTSEAGYLSTRSSEVYFSILSWMVLLSLLAMLLFRISIGFFGKNY